MYRTGIFRGVLTSNLLRSSDEKWRTIHFCVTTVGKHKQFTLATNQNAFIPSKYAQLHYIHTHDFFIRIPK